MHILVTGSSGLLGQAIATALAPNHQVVGLDRLPGPATSHLGKIEDHGLLATAMTGIDTVIHTASLHAPHVGRVDRGTFVRVNVDATRRLLELAATTGARRVVYTSTTSVYGQALVPRDRAVWVTEALRPRPRDIYDETKLAAEALCAQFSRETGLPVICLRTARFFPESPELIATPTIASIAVSMSAMSWQRISWPSRTGRFPSASSISRRSRRSARPIPASC